MTPKKITKYVCDKGHEFNEPFDVCPACEAIQRDTDKHEENMKNYYEWQSKRNYRQVDSCSTCIFSIPDGWEEHQIRCTHPIKTFGLNNFPYSNATAEYDCICDYYKKE